MSENPGLQEFNAWSLSRDSPFSDLKITCESKAFDAHKVIICNRSSVLTSALLGHFQEAKDDVYRVLHFEPEIVERMLDFMYTARYSDDTKGLRPIVFGEFAEVTAVSETVQKLFLHLRMNCIGEYYDVQNLREVANREINAIFENNWADVRLWFSAFVEHVYTCGGDRVLQSITIATAEAHMEDLRGDLPQFASLDIPKDFFSSVLCKCVAKWYS